MTKRGKILRDTSVGNGLVVVDGQQYPFMLEGTWRSEVPPAVGMTVDAEFNDAGQIVSLLVVQDSQLNKEQAQAALIAAKGKGAEIFSGIVARVGAVNLAAIVLLILAWLCLRAVSIQSPASAFNFTFWQLLGFVNDKNALEVVMAGTGSYSTGIHGFLAFVCLLGPFVRYFWKDKLAVLGGVLPLLFMLIVGMIAHSSLNSAMGVGAAGVDPNDPMVKEMTQQVSQMFSVSIGFGVYLSVLLCLYFAAMGVK